MNCETHRLLLSEEASWYLDSLSWIERQWMLIKCGGGDLFSGLLAVAVPLLLAYLVWKAGRITLREYKKDPKSTVGFFVSAVFLQVWSMAAYAIAILLGIFALLSSLGITSEVMQSWPGIVSLPLTIGSIFLAYWGATKIIAFGSDVLERWTGKRPNQQDEA